MGYDRFDDLSRCLASTTSRRVILKTVIASIGGAITAVRAPAALAKPDKVTVCVLPPGEFLYTPKQLPPAAAQAQVNSGKAIYPIVTSDDFCPEGCGPECLHCPQTEIGGVCTKCVNGQCTCPDSEAGTFSYQGGQDGTTPLLGTQYQIFNYDTSTLMIGNIPLSGVQTVTDATGVVVFGPFPGDSSVCIKEVGTPAGSTLIGPNYACLHLGCGHQFLWDFRHDP